MRSITDMLSQTRRGYNRRRVAEAGITGASWSFVSLCLGVVVEMGWAGAGLGVALTGGLLTLAGLFISLSKRRASLVEIARWTDAEEEHPDLLRTALSVEAGRCGGSLESGQAVVAEARAAILRGERVGRPL